jgi:hypothetical protein
VFTELTAVKPEFSNGELAVVFRIDAHAGERRAVEAVVIFWLDIGSAFRKKKRK